MTVLPRPPEGLEHTFEWRTDILTSRNGTEQRFALKDQPRERYSVSYLVDSDEQIQFWKSLLLTHLDFYVAFPMWQEAEPITSAITALDTTIAADFTLMDDTIGSSMLLLHPDEVTYELVTVTLPRAAGLATLASGSIVNDYPLGTLVIPVEDMYLDNGSGYTPMANNAAELDIGLTERNSRGITGKGGVAAPTHQSNVTINPGSIVRPLLERRPYQSGAKEVFSQNLQRIDYGGIIQIESDQDYAGITTGRQYLIGSREERQFWKLFLLSIKGQQKSFYTSTYRPDLTIAVQPIQGGTSFDVSEEATMITWDNTLSHSELAIETADGDTQYVTIDPAQTVYNAAQGTYTIGFLPALTNTPTGSTVVRISFLELVRLGSDEVKVVHGHTNDILEFTLRTIEA